MASMHVEVGRHKLMWSNSLKIICIFMLMLAGEIAAQCPFQYLYHFGDGITDIGNSIHVAPGKAKNPAASWPYGSNSPGYPTGRWCDGLTDFDYAAVDFGLPHIVPYLAMNGSQDNDGVIFSVARSPVLDNSFFESKNVTIPPYAVSLSRQFNWFKKYMKSVARTPKDVAKRLANSLVLMGDIEGNDIGYGLAQGKSLEEVKTYGPFVVAALIRYTRELIKMGATRIIIPGNAPLGCYPYILTALPSNDPNACDELGCLRSVNEIVVSKNNLLQRAIRNLRREYPAVTIFYGDFYPNVIKVMNQTAAGPNGKLLLKSCCGTGGKYNYNSEKFCGSPGVPVCRYPEQHIFWDGIHFTQLAYSRIETLAVLPALDTLNCGS